MFTQHECSCAFTTIYLRHVQNKNPIGIKRKTGFCKEISNIFIYCELFLDEETYPAVSVYDSVDYMNCMFANASNASDIIKYGRCWTAIWDIYFDFLLIFSIYFILSFNQRYCMSFQNLNDLKNLVSLLFSISFYERCVISFIWSVFLYYYCWSFFLTML